MPTDRSAGEDFPFPNGEYLIGRPPFSVEDELHNLSNRGVTHLIGKNAGGEASRTKLIAARQLGIEVFLIKRPPQPEGARAETVTDALRWIEAL